MGAPRLRSHSRMPGTARIGAIEMKGLEGQTITASTSRNFRKAAGSAAASAP